MALCKGGLDAIRKLWKEIDTPLESIIDTVIDFTGKLKSLEANPEVAAIVALIPAGSAIETWANKAMDEIVTVGTDIKSVAEKISTWLADKSELETNGNIFKLASTMTAVADSSRKEEHFYDSAIQLHVITNK
jgi:hypothetical protein